MKITFSQLSFAFFIVSVACSSKNEKVDLEANRKVVREYQNVHTILRAACYLPIRSNGIS